MLHLTPIGSPHQLDVQLVDLTGFQRIELSQNEVKLFCIRNPQKGEIPEITTCIESFRTYNRQQNPEKSKVGKQFRAFKTGLIKELMKRRFFTNILMDDTKPPAKLVYFNPSEIPSTFTWITALDKKSIFYIHYTGSVLAFPSTKNSKRAMANERAKIVEEFLFWPTVFMAQKREHNIDKNPPLKTC